MFLSFPVILYEIIRGVPDIHDFLVRSHDGNVSRFQDGYHVDVPFLGDGVDELPYGHRLLGPLSLVTLGFHVVRDFGDMREVDASLVGGVSDELEDGFHPGDAEEAGYAPIGAVPDV